MLVGFIWTSLILLAYAGCLLDLSAISFNYSFNSEILRSRLRNYVRLFAINNFITRFLAINLRQNKEIRMRISKRS